MTHHIKVNNVTCDGCVNTIKTELQKIEGVNTVDFNKSNLTVEINGTADRSTIIKTLQELGYPEKR